MSYEARRHAQFAASKARKRRSARAATRFLSHALSEATAPPYAYEEQLFLAGGAERPIKSRLYLTDNSNNTNETRRTPMNIKKFKAGPKLTADTVLSVGDRITTRPEGAKLFATSGAEVVKVVNVDSDGQPTTKAYAFSTDAIDFLTAERLGKLGYRLVIEDTKVTLLDVADIIEAQPERYDQGTWGDGLFEGERFGDSVRPHVADLPGEDDDEKAGACGTAFCVAGFVTDMSGSATLSIERDSFSNRMDAVWRGTDGMKLDVSRVPSIAKAELLFEDAPYTSQDLDTLFEAHWEPPAGMTVPAALRLIHRGLLKPDMDYNYNPNED